MLTIRWASSPGPGSPLAMGIAGLAAAITIVPGSSTGVGAVGQGDPGSAALDSGLGDSGSGRGSGAGVGDTGSVGGAGMG